MGWDCADKDNMKENKSEKDLRAEELEQIAGAMEGNKDSVEWCQNHFIDVLPWDKQNDWSGFNIEEIHGYPKCLWIFRKLGIKNIQECRFGLFEKISAMDTDNGHTRLALLGLRTLHDYMEKN